MIPSTLFFKNLVAELTTRGYYSDPLSTLYQEIMTTVDLSGIFLRRLS
jgi:hypothetical protein